MGKKKGFTLIEASLVFGVAGVIFIMAFIAVPALWASARDSERRDDVLTFVQKLKDFTTNNNRGALPGYVGVANPDTFFSANKTYPQSSSVTGKFNATASSSTWDGFWRDFIPSDFKDPDDTEYTPRIAKCRYDAAVDRACNTFATSGINDAGGPNHILYIVLGAVCDGSDPKSSANSRRVAVLYKMERTSAFCANN